MKEAGKVLGKAVGGVAGGLVGGLFNKKGEKTTPNAGQSNLSFSNTGLSSLKDIQPETQQYLDLLQEKIGSRKLGYNPYQNDMTAGSKIIADIYKPYFDQATYRGGAAQFQQAELPKITAPWESRAVGQGVGMDLSQITAPWEARAAGQGVGLGLTPIDLSSREAIRPYAEQYRESFRQNVVPEISAQASARGLGRSTIPVNQLTQAQGNMERDIATKVADLRLQELLKNKDIEQLNALAKREDISNALERVSQLKLTNEQAKREDINNAIEKLSQLRLSGALMTYEEQAAAVDKMADLVLKQENQRLASIDDATARLGNFITAEAGQSNAYANRGLDVQQMQLQQSLGNMNARGQYGTQTTNKLAGFSGLAGTVLQGIFDDKPGAFSAFDGDTLQDTYNSFSSGLGGAVSSFFG